MLVAPRYYDVPDDRNSAATSFIAMLDNNGVPHFHRKMERFATDFRWHAKHRTYSYAEGPGINRVIVLLDDRFEETARALTVAPVTRTDSHDFLITDEGNYLLLSYNPANRDLSSYEDPDGNPYSANESTRDSVIQEVSPQGTEVFRWNSWDHIKISDCLQHRFPDDYAHINSLQLVDGDIIASFRGCSQVLKIERPSGRVIWQLGGSDPGEADPHDSNREVFADRTHYSVPPEDQFCGQHSAVRTERGTIVLFDNGIHCLGDRTDTTDADVPGRTRVVEFELVSGSARVVREYRPEGQARSYSAGAVQVLENGNWFITWGRLPPRSITEYDPDREMVVFDMDITDPRPTSDAIAVTYRAYRERDLDLLPNLP